MYLHEACILQVRKRARSHEVSEFPPLHRLLSIVCLASFYFIVPFLLLLDGSLQGSEDLDFDLGLGLLLSRARSAGGSLGFGKGRSDGLGGDGMDGASGGQYGAPGRGLGFCG